MDKDDLKEKALGLLMRLISIESVTGKEGKALEFLGEEATKRGFHCSLEPVPGATGNLVLRRGNSKVLLATHVDTVPAWGHPFAFHPHLEGEILWGRGSLDAKGQIVALLLASELTEAPFSVALFCDEEGEGKGSRFFSPSEGITWALVLEPTGMKIGVAQAGWIEVAVSFKGNASHGSMASFGKNAIEEFLKAWEAVRTLPFLSYSNPLFPPLRPNLGAVRGGIDPQVVPEECTALIDFPVPPGYDVDKAEALIKEVFEGFGAEVTVKDKEPPWEKGHGEEGFIRLIEEAIKSVLFSEPVFWGMPAWTDASNLRKKGITAFVLGAGELSFAHTPEERISITEVVQLSLVLAKLMETVNR